MVSRRGRGWEGTGQAGVVSGGKSAEQGAACTRCVIGLLLGLPLCSAALCAQDSSGYKAASGAVGLGCGLRFGFSNQLLGDAEAFGPGATLKQRDPVNNQVIPPLGKQLV